MIIRRITACTLAAMICLQAPLSALAADATLSSTAQEEQQKEADADEQGAAGEQVAEGQTAEGPTAERQTTGETAAEEQTAGGRLAEETAIEEADADAGAAADEMIEGSEQADEVSASAEEAETAEASEAAEAAEASEAAKASAAAEAAETSEATGEDSAEIIESDAATAADQNTAADAVEQNALTVKGWHKIGSRTFYVKQNLSLARGVTKIGKVKYIFDPVTGELRTGLVTSGGATYLADSNGKMLTGWHTVNKKKYYFTDKHYSEYKESNEGKRLSGFIYVSGHRYYLMNEKMKGYKKSNFAARVTGWATIKGYTYYMDPKTGIVATGFQTINGKRYYFNETGSRQPYTKWREIGGKRYYFNADHSIQRGMSTIDGARYYLSSVTGEVMCGWKSINGRKYYFADERYRFYNKSIRGQRLTGFKEIGGKTYYFITSSMDGYNKVDYASRATGWKTINKKTYYFYKDGHRQECGRVVINGNVCAFDPNGVCRSRNSKISDVVQYALKWEGKIGYKSSATNSDPNEERKKELTAGGSTDCSWFVFHCLARYGYVSEFVHSYEWGSKPSKYPGGKEIGKDLSKAKAGDVICYAYGSPRKSGNSHVSIYLGNGEEIHCADGRGVIRSKVQKKDIINIVRFSN